MSNDSEQASKHVDLKEVSTIFNPSEFAAASHPTSTLAGVLFTRLNAEIEASEKKHLQLLIQDLRQGKLDPRTPPYYEYDYLIEIIQFYDDTTMATVDMENDIDVEVSTVVLAPYRALKLHYCNLKNRK